MLKIYYAYYIKSLEKKLATNKEKAESFKQQKDKLEDEILNYYTRTKYDKPGFLNAIKTKTLTKGNFNDEITYQSFNLKIQDLKVINEEYKKYVNHINLVIKLNVDYKTFGIIVDTFLLELRDEFIKGNVCVYNIPFFGSMAITLKYPKVRISKKTGNPLYPVSWVKSKKYKAELIAKGVKVREKGEIEGENWLLPMTDPYPIIRWFKFQYRRFRTEGSESVLNKLVFRVASTLITDLYVYLESNPNVKRKYETVGNAYVNKLKQWMEYKKSLANQS
jgi:hypothetical protein